MTKKAIIIGAGPAGLTAAYELLKRTDIKPIILEKSGDIGGISKTINYKGNRMDIGGHRFFSKSDRVMNWWLNIMPVQPNDADTYTTITYQRKHRTIKQEETPIQGNSDNKVMLIRKRLSRIYFLRKFFTYPIQLSIDTLTKLGPVRTLGILVSYLKAQVFKRNPEKSLEDFLINRFGRKLYLLFFKDYTEKVWGVPCNEISAEWGAQRIKGVSISKAIQHAAQMVFKKKKSTGDISQKDTETSLIEQFLYPALGPGQLWEEVARQIEILGGTIIMNQDVKEINSSGNSVSSVITVDSKTGEQQEYEGDYFFSTMPVQELIAGMNGTVPPDVKEIAAGLQYRDFITVGVLLEKLSSTDNKTGKTNILDLKDTWIYIQEKDVKVGRLQLFNNWSPYMVNKPGTVWIGMEYFCNKSDAFWNLTDSAIQRTAIEELEKMGLAQVQDVLDSTVHRVEKTYPAYFGTYNEFDKVRAYVDQFENLFLVGRNGMHKYNNSDHSMLTAMTAVDNICEGASSKENIWAINTEQEYHEEKAIAGKEQKTKKTDEQYPKPAIVNPQVSFKDFIWYNKQNRLYLILAAIAIIIQFTAFKIFYPMPGFVSDDSYAYLETAYYNYSINTYPVGYSNFLRLFSAFTKSDLALVAFQYFFIQSSLLWLLFTFFYFYKPSKAVHIFLLCFWVLNPIFLYLSNYIISDALFLPLSIIWFTTLLWIIYKPLPKLIIWHGVILFLAFTVRYNALYYPIISTIAFFISKQKMWKKFAGPAFAVILIGLFILATGNKYKTYTGTWQFSPFTGWQMANNALYAYRYIDSADRKPTPRKFAELDKMVRNYFDTTRNVLKYPQETLVASTVYMWTPNSPLQKYMEKKSGNDTTLTKFKKWATVGPILNEYGKWLIKNYPLAFTEHYLLPNAMKYYAPPTEFLAFYNHGKPLVKDIGQTWFGFKNNEARTAFKNYKVSILEFFPPLTGAFNVIFIFGLICYLFLNGLKNKKALSHSLLLVTSLWLLNFCFSVFASPVALRFELFPLMIYVCFAALLLEYVSKSAFLPINRFRDDSLKRSAVVAS